MPTAAMAASLCRRASRTTEPAPQRTGLSAGIEDAFPYAGGDDRDGEGEQEHAEADQDSRENTGHGKARRREGIYRHNDLRRSRSGLHFDVNAVSAARHQPELGVEKIGVALDGFCDVRWRRAFHSRAPVDRQHGDAFHSVRQHAHIDRRQSWNHARRANDHANRHLRRVAFVNDGEAADVRLRTERKQEPQQDEKAIQSHRLTLAIQLPTARPAALVASASPHATRAEVVVSPLFFTSQNLFHISVRAST